MDEFVCRRNIEYYQKLLAAMQDGAERRLVLELLAAEEAKLAVSSVNEPRTTVEVPKSRHGHSERLMTG